MTGQTLALAGLAMGLASVLPRLVRADDSAREMSAKERTDKTVRAAMLHYQEARLAEQGRCIEALKAAEEALTLRRELFPPASYPDGHEQLAASLNDLGLLHQEMGDYEKSLPYLVQARDMYRKLLPRLKPPTGPMYLAASLNNLGTLYRQIGANDKALMYYEESLAILRKTFPDGHRFLATSLNNTGELLNHVAAPEKALACCAEALAMRRKLYPAGAFPNGHADLAESLNNMGCLLQQKGESKQAIAHLEEALAVQRKLFPEPTFPTGHPGIANTLFNLSLPLWDVGEHSKATQLVEESLRMRRRLYPPESYPQGHPKLAGGVGKLSEMRLLTGDPAAAVPLARESLDQCRKLFDRETATAPEVDALALAGTFPEAADTLLTATLQVPNSDRDAYDAVWDSKAMVTRMLERRHATARAASEGHERTSSLLRDNRRQTEKALLLPPGTQRNLRLSELADQRDRLERELAAALPVLARWKQRDRLGPADLANALPKDAVFVDFVLYNRFDRVKTERSDRVLIRRASYAAFVLVHGRPPRRVELGDAKPIDAAILAWRTALTHGDDGAAASKFRQAVWAKIASLVPADARVLYLSPEGDLARVPWIAMPGARPGSVLLDEFAGGVAFIPHGPFLLEQLRFPASRRPSDRVLALGGVDYGNSKWPRLEGADQELRSVALPDAIMLRDKGAVGKRLIDELPTARFAHLATHGFFAEQELSEEKRRALCRLTGDTSPADLAAPRLTAAKNPLAYSGLVLADGEILTGLSIVDLALENLEMVTLSACETGLGEFTGGKGVENLQLAFHIAGCPNVIASLWKVHDAATAALMAKFYHELWVSKRPPIEALREAQLTIYRHPERIPALAGERGKPDLAKTVELKSDSAAAPKDAKRTPTKLWAAFVLSGAGK